ncbi:MAG: Gp15 family bacteriophage protein [Clostridia bacterium]|jgi:hypothetical protein|nr:MAG TPA: hypothetical protein [Caudoviricetes sp.]
MNKYPNFVKVKNKKYKINTDFRTAIKCQEIATNNCISDEERALAIIYVLFGNEGIDDSENWNELLKLAIKYLNCGKEVVNDKEESNMEYQQDMKYIEPSFFYDYKIDLPNTKMHWWKFYDLLCGLSEKCILNRVRFIRDFDISQIKNSKERQKWIKQKQRVALKKEIRVKNEREKKLDLLFEKQLRGEKYGS